MIRFLVFYCVLFGNSEIVSSGRRYHNRRPHWNGGRKGNGGYNYAPTNYHNFYAKNPFNFPEPTKGTSGENAEDRHCSYPVVSGGAKFELDTCRKNPRQQCCRSPPSYVSYGETGRLSCLRGRSLLRLTSQCTEGGTWNPPLVKNCDELFQLLYSVKGGGKSEGVKSNVEFNIKADERRKPSFPNCPEVNLDRTPNFVISCIFSKQSDPVLDGETCMQEFNYGIPQGTKLSVKCRPPFVSVEPHGNEFICQDGRWIGQTNHIICSPSIPSREGTANFSTNPATPVKPELIIEKPTPPKPITYPPNSPTPPSILNTTSTTTCPPLKPRSSSVQLSCLRTGNTVVKTDCDSRHPIGTEAKYSCAEYFESRSRVSAMFRKCKQDGTWSGTSDFSCVVSCGRENVIKVPFITHSKPTLRGQWPWHAGIFRNSTGDKDSWDYICGAALITKKALLTAAHCVTKLQTSQVVEEYNMRIHLGKYRREDNDENVQIKEIAKIIVNGNYNPYNFDSDLAVIILKREVKIGYYVRPVCFLTTTDSVLEELQLADNSVGTVVGWGYDENNKLADHLRMAQLRVVGTRECAKSMLGSSISQLNVRSTTYCAGFSNGTNVCNGDSGSGMYFPLQDTDDKKWYIQGLVSVGITDIDRTCKPEVFSVFTRLGRYADFITRTLSEFDAL